MTAFREKEQSSTLWSEDNSLELLRSKGEAICFLIESLIASSNRTLAVGPYCCSFIFHTFRLMRSLPAPEDAACYPGHVVICAHTST